MHSDNGGEYGSKLFETYLKEKGTFHQTTVPQNPAQNEVSEIMNRTLVENARSMMPHATMPVEFWADAISTAVYLRTRSPTVLLHHLNACLIVNLMSQILKYLDV